MLAMFLRQSTRCFHPSVRYFNTKNTHYFKNEIAELNDEMEAVFGEAPSSGDITSRNSTAIAQEPNFASLPIGENAQGIGENAQGIGENVQGLTHINSTGEAAMVDVSLKNISKRVAIASCKVILGKEVFDLVSANQIVKGDVLSVARIAGISGAKQTSNLIPLCHNISLTHVQVNLSLKEKDHSVKIEGKVSSTGKTGVEMEAMTAVTIASLTVYDMCKAASKNIQITDIQLEHKSGGKSGLWSRMK